MPHKEEYYLSVSSERLTYEISFCEAGGMDIEEHWDKLKTVKFDTNEALTGGRERVGENQEIESASGSGDLKAPWGVVR